MRLSVTLAAASEVAETLRHGETQVLVENKGLSTHATAWGVPTSVTTAKAVEGGLAHPPRCGPVGPRGATL